MQYYRCKCGNLESWGSDGTTPCRSCPKCGTTLAQHPADHRKPVPHQWQTLYDRNTGKPYKVCRVCLTKKEDVVCPAITKPVCTCGVGEVFYPHLHDQSCACAHDPNMRAPKSENEVLRERIAFLSRLIVSVNCNEDLTAEQNETVRALCTEHGLAHKDGDCSEEDAF